MPQPLPSVSNFSTPPPSGRPATPPTAPEPAHAERASFRQALRQVKKQKSDAKPVDAKDSAAKAGRSGKSAPRKTTTKVNVPMSVKKPNANPKHSESADDGEHDEPAGNQQKPRDPNPDARRPAKEAQRRKPEDQRELARPAAVVQLRHQPPPKAPVEASRTEKQANASRPEQQPTTTLRPIDPQRPRQPQSSASDHPPQPAKAAGEPANGQTVEQAQPPPVDPNQAAPAPANDATETTPHGKPVLAIQPKQSSTDEQPSPINVTTDAAAMPVPIDPSLDDDTASPSDSATEPTIPVSRAESSPPDDPSLKAAVSPTASPALRAPASPQPAATVAAPPPAPQTPEAQFAQANHSSIVTAVHGQLLPNGGSMHIRLDPPELGAVRIHVEMRDGIMTASFETTNDQATKLLSHSLGELKTSLEAQGVTIDRLHVRQATKEQSSSGEGRQDDRDRQQEHAANQEQQRKEMLRQMWRRLMKGQGPLDLVA